MNTKYSWPTWPKLNQHHEEAVVRVLRSNQLYAATEVAAFEKEYADYLNARHTIGVGNATQGLHLALCALGVGSGDEVIVTPYSWISSASCVLMQNSIPIFADIEPDSFGICPDALIKLITKRTRAVILVHMFGLASKVDMVLDICKSHNIALIEDASHSHGAKLNGKSLGTFGDIGVFSLHQRKAISTGDGGIMCTNNDNLYEKLRKLRSFGSEQLSFNYRMTEFSAALARVGLRSLDGDNEKRRRNHAALVEGLKNSVCKVIEPRSGVEAVFYSNLLDINLPSVKQDSILERCSRLGIPLKRTWQPLNLHPHFKRQNMINNVAPWDHVDTFYEDPAMAQLPISKEFQEKRLFELDCHPLVDELLLQEVAKDLNEIVNE
jgi:dTDP-4-amino-4,6-dideoxygalactose transaminase